MALSIIARLLGRGGRAAHSVRDAPPDMPEHPSSHEALSTPAVATQPLRPADAGACGDDDATLAKVQVGLERTPQQERTLSQEAAPWQEAQPEPTAQVKPEAQAGQAAQVKPEAQAGQAAQVKPEVQAGQTAQAGQEVPAHRGQDAPEGLGPSAALKGSSGCTLPKHRIYHALGNSNQMLGCDRELFLINLLVAAALIFLSHSLVVFAVTTPVALLLFLGLHQMGKRDLLLRHVFIRQLHYQHYYLAQARIGLPPRKRY